MGSEDQEKQQGENRAPAQNNIGGRVKTILIAVSIGLAAAIIFGLLWLFLLAPATPAGTFGWFLFSFAAGLSMIVLPCTLPLAFVIVPLSMGRGVAKGLGMALSFGIGVAVMLSIYGVIAAALGGIAIDALGAPLESIKNWVYFIAGIFALVFALGEIKLLRVRMPSYSGAAPAFIQHRKDFLKAFLLGLFLGNIGVGCPHPATPLIFIEIASSGDILYGWLLFLVHAVGRVLPLLLLAFLGILGVNGLKWIVARKDKVEKATGWAMIFVAGFILTLGLFTHDWWVNSGIHTQLESFTQEERVLDILNEQLGTEAVHAHGIEEGSGLFGLPLELGNYFLVAVWLVPIWWWWLRKRRRVAQISEENRVSEKTVEHRLLVSRGWFFVTLTILLSLVFIYLLPHNFLKHEALESHDSETAVVEESGEESDEHMHGVTDNHEEDNSTEEPSLLLHKNTGYTDESAVTEGLVVNFNISPRNPKTLEVLTLEFFVNTRPSRTPVTDIEIEHDKFMHVIGVRDDLNEFFHIHPEKRSAGLWGIEHVFDKPGMYRVWSDVKVNGEAQSFGHPRFSVSGGGFLSEKNVEFLTDVIIDERYQVELDHDLLVVGREVEIVFTLADILADASSSGITIEQFLGADMHLVIIKDDLNEYIHVHPHSRESELPVKTVAFTTTFSNEGIYKLFAQFRPKGVELALDQSLIAEFFVQVVGKVTVETEDFIGDDHIDHTHVAPANEVPWWKDFLWWIFIIVSLVLTGLLSIGVYKYINVKE